MQLRLAEPPLRGRGPRGRQLAACVAAWLLSWPHCFVRAHVHHPLLPPLHTTCRRGSCCTRRCSWPRCCLPPPPPPRCAAASSPPPPPSAAWPQCRCCSSPSASCFPPSCATRWTCAARQVRFPPSGCCPAPPVPRFVPQCRVARPLWPEALRCSGAGTCRVAVLKSPFLLPLQTSRSCRTCKQSGGCCSPEPEPGLSMSTLAHDAVPASADTGSLRGPEPCV